MLGKQLQDGNHVLPGIPSTETVAADPGLPRLNDLGVLHAQVYLRCSGRERDTRGLGGRRGGARLEGLLCSVCKTKSALSAVSQEKRIRTRSGDEISCLRFAPPVCLCMLPQGHSLHCRRAVSDSPQTHGVGWARKQRGAFPATLAGLGHLSPKACPLQSGHCP